MLRPTLRWKITVLAFGVVLVSITVAGLLLARQTAADFQDELGRRALAIARTVALTPGIRDNVGLPGGEKLIQPLAERIRLATNVDYIVVLDMQHKRYSHPVANRIGQRFAGGDEGPAFADNEYTSLAGGVLGEAVRAFVPIKDEEGFHQVGVVVVGILTPSVGEILLDMKAGIYGSLFIGLLVGTGGAIVLARSIKRAIFGLEPEEIATLVEQREAMVEAISEGIVAIDRENRITLVNQAALRIMGVAAQKVLGKNLLDLIPYSRLPEVMVNGSARYNQEILLGSTVVVSNQVPIRLRGKIVGAVAVFRDKTEVRRLAEELTGVKKFVEALRVQNHENLNKLHTIAGLIQLERYEEALDYILRTTEAQQELTALINKTVKDGGVAGLLLGKLGRARELNIDLQIDRLTRLDRVPQQLGSSGLVVILGNLLENAMEAVSQAPQENRWVRCGIKTLEKRLVLWVVDGGPGLPFLELDTIFQPSFTTKATENRGLGLHLIKKQVESARGTIAIRSRVNEGATFIINVPMEEDWPNEKN